MDNTTQDYSNQPATAKKNMLPIIIIAVVLVIVLIGGFFLFTRNTSGKPPVVTGTTTIAPTAAPSPTPTPAIAKDSVLIQVLNGTGTPGQAAKVVASLKTAGYNTDNIKTGNTPDTASTSSIVAKAGFESIAADMKTVLSSDYPDIKVATTPLDTGSAFDIVVTTGGKAYAAPTSSPTPQPSPSATAAAATPSTTQTPTPTPSPTTTPTPTPTH
jgi:flagellar basal body-associated protein FliL